MRMYLQVRPMLLNGLRKLLRKIKYGELTLVWVITIPKFPTQFCEICLKIQDGKILFCITVYLISNFD